MAKQQSDTQKHRRFVSEPMGNKDVEALPGIGDKLGKALKEKGYTKAIHVYGKFLELDQDESAFKKWLNETCGANTHQQEECFRTVKEWHQQFGDNTMAHQDVEVLGKDLAGKLKEKGFTKVIHVFGKFLQLDRNEEKFKKWLEKECGANESQQEECFKYLKEWADKLCL